MNPLSILNQAILSAQADDRLWMPIQASTVAEKTDALFYLILGLGIFFFFLIVIITLVFAIKYRRRGDDDVTSPISGNHTLEIWWAVIPSIILAVLFFLGFQQWITLGVTPANAIDIRVTAQKWSWSFEYPTAGINTNELVVPLGQPVQLTMSSKDVIHSFFVPAFRVKRDVLPNRYTVLWFEATKIGEYNVFCTEYCGTGHSKMLSKVIVKSPAEYQEWLASGGGMGGEGMDSVAFGEMLYQKKGCAACHSISGQKMVGPFLNAKYGIEETLADGSTVTVDDNYLRESLIDPGAKVVNGFQPVMPTFKGQLNDQQINAIIDYIKSLSE